MAAAAQPLPPELEAVAARLPAQERERLLQRQQRLAELGPEARAALAARLAEWDALPEEEKRAQREAWAAWRELPADERARMRQARARFEALPRERQAALRQRFDAMDGTVRRGWLLGPVLGGDWPRLHPLFAQVPAGERQAVLEALRGLSRQGRADLAVLAQRTPPEAREAVRRELLSLPPEAREAWLRERTGRP